MRGPLRWLLIERGSGATTKRTDATMAGDLQRQSPPTTAGQAAIEWALRMARLRYESTVAVETNRPGKKAGRQVDKVERKVRKWCDYQVRVRSNLSSPRMRSIAAQVTAYDRSSALLGHLSAWVLPISFLLYVAMGLSDPGYVLAATRRALQVPPSVSTWDLTHRDNLISFAVALAVTALLLVTIKLAAAGIASLLFWESLARQRELHPEMASTVAKITLWQRAVVTVSALAVILFVTHVVHEMAAGQFTNTQAMALADFNGTAATREAVVLLISNLSWLILVIEVAAHVPALEHARRTSRWALRLRVVQAVTLRRDQRFRRSCLTSLRRLENTVNLVKDVIADIGRRLRQDVVEAGIATGALPTDVVIAAPAARESGAAVRPHVSDAGVPDLDLDQALPPASHRILHVLQRSSAARRDIEAISGLELDWHDLRQSSESYCGIEVSPAACVASPIHVVGPDEGVDDARIA